MRTPRQAASLGNPKFKKLRKSLHMKNKTQINDAEQDQSDRANKIHSKKQEYFNRSSPMKIVRLYKHMNPSQRKLLQAYGFGSLLDIKCSKLQPQLCKYLMEHFNPDTCQLEFGARGSIPVTEEAVHKVLGIPMGREPVVHELSIDAISFMLEQLGIQNGTQPKIVDIEKELAKMNAADERYLRLWLMYVICSVLAPTTGTRVSPRCYSSLLDTRRIPALNWCRFVITMLIKAAKDKDKKNIFKACMPFLMIFYIDSLDIQNNMEVNKRGKRISVWTNKMVKTAVALDTSEDGEFGMLPLKNKFRNRETILFGDQTVIDKFVRDNVPENCTPRDVARYRTAAQEMCNDFQGILATFIRNCSARDSTARPSCSKKKSTAERCYARSRLADNAHKRKERPVYEDGLSVSESSPDTSDMGYDGESDENECESDMGNYGESDANESESEDISQPHDHQGPYCQERVLQQGQTNDVLPRRKRVHEESDSEHKYHKRKNYGSRHHMSKLAGTSRDGTTLQKQHKSYAKAERCTQSTLNHMDIKPPEHGRDRTQKQMNVKSQEGSNAGHKRQHMKKFDTSKLASDDTRATEGVISRKTVQKYRERSGRSQCFEGASHSVFKQEQPTVKQPDGIGKTKRSKGLVKPTTISCTQLGVNESKRDIVKAVEVNRKEQHSLSATRQLLEQLGMCSADSSQSSDEDITNEAPRSWPDIGKEPSTGLPVSLPRGTNEAGRSSEGIIGGQNSHILVGDAQNNEVAAVTRSMSPLSISKGIHVLDGKQVSQDRQAKPHQSPPMRCKTLAHAENASASSEEPATLNNSNSVSPRSSVTYAVPRSMSPLAISKWKGSYHGKGNAESQEQLENIAQSTLKSQENVTAAVTASSSMEPAGTSDTNQEHTPQHSGHKTEIRSNTNQSAAISNDSSISRQLNFDSAESERASQRQHLIADCPSLDLSIDGTLADVNHKPDDVTGMSGTQVERREAIPAECIAPTDPLVISSSDEDEVLLIPIQAIRNSSPDEDYIAMSQPKDLGRGGVDDSVEIVTTKLSNTRHIAPFSFDRGSTSTTTPIVAQGSNTPVPQPHQKRVVRPGKMQKFVISEHTRRLYDAVCRHAKKSPPIKDETIIIDFGSYFIYLYDLADSVEPEGKLSNSTCEIALHILKQEMLPERKFVMPLQITIMFPRMVTLSDDQNTKIRHYYLIVLNLMAKRFEVLDSLKLDMQPIMIEDCNKIVGSIRNRWATKYNQSNTGIQDYPIEHIVAPTQQTIYDCGYFMLKYIELWDGRNIANFHESDMPNIRMLYTEKWVNWEQNKRWSCKRKGCYIRVCSMSNKFCGWADLPSGPLDSIISRLGSFHDLLAFQATCRHWHAVFSSCPFKYTLAALFPPLLLQPDGSQCSPHPHSVRNFTVPTRPCRVTDIANKGTTYQGFQIPIAWISNGKSTSPSPMENLYFSGASYGHLIFSSNKSCVVFDVFTGVTVSCPQLPVLDEGTGPIVYGALTAPLASANSYLIIEVGSQNLFWRVGSHSWVARSPHHAPMKQIVVFQGQVFGLDSYRRLFKLQLTPQQIRITELQVRGLSMISNLSDTWLVTCGNMLLLVGLRGPGERFKVFRLDLSTDPALWLKMEKLEDWAIFISKDNRSQTLSSMNPEKWGGRSNHIYCYDSKSKRRIQLNWASPGREMAPNSIQMRLF